LNCFEDRLYLHTQNVKMVRLQQERQNKTCGQGSSTRSAFMRRRFATCSEAEDEAPISGSDVDNLAVPPLNHERGLFSSMDYSKTSFNWHSFGTRLHLHSPSFTRVHSPSRSTMTAVAFAPIVGSQSGSFGVKSPLAFAGAGLGLAGLAQRRTVGGLSPLSMAESKRRLAGRQLSSPALAGAGTDDSESDPKPVGAEASTSTMSAIKVVRSKSLNDGGNPSEPTRKSERSAKVCRRDARRILRANADLPL
jgi:hypothetical protein